MHMYEHALPRTPPRSRCAASSATGLGRGDDAVGNPHRAQSYRFELFELTLLSKLDRQFPVEQFEATVSQSTVPPLLKAGGGRSGVAAGPGHNIYIYIHTHVYMYIFTYITT